jgi:hypothetical protein
MATSRAKFNPMEYVLRTVAMVRGNHPYGLVVDDVKKDDGTHLYQWAGMLNGGVWKASVNGLRPNEVVIGYDQTQPDGPQPGDIETQRPALMPRPGDPLLYLCALNAPTPTSGELITVATQPGPADRNNKPTAYDRITINVLDTQAAFHVLLVPYKMGEPLPKITGDEASATITWGDQQDKLTFTQGADHKTEVKVERGGQVILDRK